MASIGAQPQIAKSSAAGRPFYDDVRRRLGLRTRLEARRVARVVVGAMRDVITRDEANILARAMPEELSAILLRPSADSTGDVDELVLRVGEREKVGRGFAIEHTLAICQAVGARLSPDDRRRLTADLPAKLRDAFDSTPETHLERQARATTPSGRETLATGRPGSHKPLSEGRPPGPQQDSVATPNPHAETKLSSARGLTQERLEETLAEGSPPQGKPAGRSGP